MVQKCLPGVFTEADLDHHSIHVLIQIAGSSPENLPVSAVQTSIHSLINLLSWCLHNRLRKF